MYLCAAGVAFADTATGAIYLDVPGANCKVWAPSGLARSDFVPRYSGGCKDGKAQGQGKLEWLLRFAGMRPQTVWEGNFDRGVFLADLPSSTTVDPIPGDRYLVRAGHIDSGELTIVATSPQTGAMHLCPAENVAVQLAPGSQVAQDDVVKRAMLEAAKRYQAMCPNATGTPLLSVYDAPVVANPQGYLPQAAAAARMDWSTHELSSYNNGAAQQARVKASQDAAADRIAAAQRQFDAFTQQFAITSWVTTSELDANPFRYEGKIVGVVVRMERMATRDVALVGDGLTGGSLVQLHGVTPDFPDRSQQVVIAAKVGRVSR